MMRILRENDVQALITMEDALSAVELAFREQFQGSGINEPRRRVRQPGGVLNLMGGALTERGYWGFKAYPATREGVLFSVMLYDAQSGAAQALIEANYLGQLRTGAASGVATKYLAAPQARRLALFGTGYQAETQLAAIAAVRQLEDVRVYSRKPERREQFVARLQEQMGLPLRAVESPQAAVAGADIITTATTARTPVFDGSEIAAGTHVNAAGSNSAAKAEIDATTVRRASHIFVDDMEQARIESGDLIMAYERNALVWEQVRLLADVVGGLLPGRTDPTEITLFASQGIALWDLALAALVYERAVAQDVGSLIDFGS
jgi:ornithine cyclodeaminase/alanine dehydrogenase-like protein (mu-crystallin family)